jgi:hypothetical protein
MALLLAAALSYAGTTVVVMKHPAGGGGGGCNTSAITFWWRAEAADFSATDGTLDFSPGDNTGTATGTPTIGASAGKNGTNGVISDATGDYYLFTVSGDDLVDGSQGCIGAWAQIPSTWPQTGREIVAIRNVGATRQLRLYFTGSSGARTASFAVTDGGGASTTVTTGSYTNSAAWFWYVGCWDATQAAGSDAAFVEVYNSSLSLIASSYNSTATIADIPSGDLTQLRVGSTNGTGAADVYHDHIIIYNTYASASNVTTCANQANYDNS